MYTSVYLMKCILEGSRASKDSPHPLYTSVNLMR